MQLKEKIMRAEEGIREFAEQNDIKEGMTMEDKIKAIYDGLNESEKFGVQFGMFPVRLQNLSIEETVQLMEYRKNTAKQDVNK